MNKDVIVKTGTVLKNIYSVGSDIDNAMFRLGLAHNKLILFRKRIPNGIESAKHNEEIKYNNFEQVFDTLVLYDTMHEVVKVLREQCVKKFIYGNFGRIKRKQIESLCKNIKTATANTRNLFSCHFTKEGTEHIINKYGNLKGYIQLSYVVDENNYDVCTRGIAELLVSIGSLDQLFKKLILYIGDICNKHLEIKYTQGLLALQQIQMVQK